MTTHSGRVRMLVVDDHAAIRRGLRHWLAACADIAVVGEAGMPSLPPDIIPFVTDYAPIFSEQVWVHALELLIVAGLTPAKRISATAITLAGVVTSLAQW